MMLQTIAKIHSPMSSGNTRNTTPGGPDPEPEVPATAVTKNSTKATIQRIMNVIWKLSASRLWSRTKPLRLPSVT